MSTDSDKHFDEIKDIGERIGGETGVSLATKTDAAMMGIRFKKILAKLEQLPMGEIYTMSRHLRTFDYDDEANTLISIGVQISDLKNELIKELAKALPKTRIK